MDTDIAAIASAIHLQGRIEEEQCILAANGHARAANAAHFWFNSDHEVDSILHKGSESG